MIDQLDFTNTMATIGWSTPATAGFEAIAYGAALTLIHYQDQLTPAGRQAWATANNRASDIGQQGIQKTRQGFFLSMVNQLRLQTFGTGFSDESITHQTILATTPWALMDSQFQYCMNYIRTGQIPDDKQFRKDVLNPTEQMVADKVGGTIEKEALKYPELGAGFVGGRGLALLLKVKSSTLGGVATDIVWTLLKTELEKQIKADVIARFRTDETRRIYLASKGQSTYKAIT